MDSDGERRPRRWELRPDAREIAVLRVARPTTGRGEQLYVRMEITPTKMAAPQGTRPSVVGGERACAMVSGDHSGSTGLVIGA